MEDYDFLMQYDYRRNFLCLRCKKSILWPNLYQIAQKNGDNDLLMRAFTPHITPKEKEYLQKFYFDAKQKCPTCQSEIFEIPSDYEVPSKKSRKWKTIEMFVKAKGYVRKDISSSKKALKSLLEFEVENTKYRLSNLSYFMHKNESEVQAQTRLKNEITQIMQQVEKLQK